MEVTKWRARFEAIGQFFGRFPSMLWEFLGDTSPWPKRHMLIERPDGTHEKVLILSQEGDTFIIERRITDPKWYTFWLFEAETLVVHEDDLMVVKIDPRTNWREALFGCRQHV